MTLTPVSTYARLKSEDKDSGLMSSANGRLSVENLDANFQLKAEHIQPEQASLARIGSVLDTSTIYGTGVAETVSETGIILWSPAARFVGISRMTLQYL